MIEAVNSVLANSSLSRGAAEQQSALRSFAANPERVQEIPKAPYISPYIHVDTNFDKAVLQIRDSETGDVVRQFPSESQLEAYRRAQSTSTQAQPVRSQADVERSVSAEDVAGVPADVPTPEAPQAQASAPEPQAAPTPQAPASSGVDTQA